MAHLITGYAGHAHINSADQGSFNAAFFGTGEFVMEMGNQFAASIVNNNTVRIQDGDLLMQGRHIRIEPNSYEDMTIETGTAGKNRVDLIVMAYSRDSNTGIETAELQVIKGTETTGTAIPPDYQSGDILNNAVNNQMALYKVNLDGVELKSVTKLFKVIPTYKTLAEQYEAEFVTACNNYLDSLNVLDTYEEIAANTLDNQLAGALAVKEAVTDLKKLTNISVSGYAKSSTDDIYAPDYSRFTARFTKAGRVVIVYLYRPTDSSSSERDIPASGFSTICKIPDGFEPIDSEYNTKNYVNMSPTFIGQMNLSKLNGEPEIKIGYFYKAGEATDYPAKSSLCAKIVYNCKE